MTVQANPLMTLRVHLHQLSCPTCGSQELFPTLRCNYSPDRCLWLVRCETCQTQFHINHRNVPT